MSRQAIECRAISKKYLINHAERYLALRDRLSPGNLMKALTGRLPKPRTEDFWALRDVSFDVAPGEAVGIIGRNGAGKSTLLKVLSRITTPTSGEVKIRGRVASLLEVGTGFHPELTGRENIYLNGAILGMTRGDITKQFDSIVGFSGVEKFVDTPVKRYSSGMYVRLAFAVAAHLEPEILIVDEVLAVGDAEFQKKCLGKMKDVARNDGRTVLFVSHNMIAVQSFCKRAIWMNGGGIVEDGEASHVVGSYLHHHGGNRTCQMWPDRASAPGNEQVRIRSVKLVPDDAANPELSVVTPFRLEFEFWNLQDKANLNVTIELNTLDGQCVFAVAGAYASYEQGLFRVSCAIPGDFLNDRQYALNLMIVKDRSSPIFVLEDALTFQVNDVPREGGWMGKWQGVIRPNALEWTMARVSTSTLVTSGSLEPKVVGG